MRPLLLLCLLALPLAAVAEPASAPADPAAAEATPADEIGPEDLGISLEELREFRRLGEVQATATRGYRALIKGQRNEAERAFRRCLENDPDCFTAMLGLADVLRARLDAKDYSGGTGPNALEENRKQLERLLIDSDRRAEKSSPKDHQVALAIRNGSDKETLRAAHELRILAGRVCARAQRAVAGGDVKGAFELLAKAKALDPTYLDAQRLQALLEKRLQTIEHWQQLVKAVKVP